MQQKTESHMSPPTHPLLEVKDLSIAFPSARFADNKRDKSTTPVVNRTNFSLKSGEIMAIVGESGSGKTMVARALLGLLPSGGIISKGSINFSGEDLTKFDQQQWKNIRGQKISMIFQEPMVSLNPTLKIGFQICEAMSHHTSLPYQTIWARAVELLTQVKIKDPEQCMHKFPHEFSGGMRQRIMIASSLMMKPDLLIADEPTTALDCIVQKEVMDILLNTTRNEGTAVLLITHDLGLVAHYASKVLVMEKGNVVEGGKVSNILDKPTHPYTRKLLSSLPHKPEPLEAEAEAEAEAETANCIVSIKNLCVDYPIRRQWFWQQQQYNRVLHNINMDMRAGETLAIVGESGSGKTSLGRAILQLVNASKGSISVSGIPITGENPPSLRDMSPIVQLIFQDPYASLSPRQTIGKSISEPLLLKPELGKDEITKLTKQALKDVGLPDDYYNRYPNELSGGQRQRVSIARALISKPKLIIADEPVSALDITVQAQILSLLTKLKQKYGFSCIFISHDLSVVEQVADRVVVLLHGHIVEWGSSEALFNRPAHPYTQKLLAALPELQAKGEGSYALHTREHQHYPLPSGYQEAADYADAQLSHVKLSDSHYVACQKTL